MMRNGGLPRNRRWNKRRGSIERPLEVQLAAARPVCFALMAQSSGTFEKASAAREGNE